MEQYGPHERMYACFRCVTGGKQIGDWVLGKLNFFCCFRVGVMLILLIAGCGGGGSHVNPRTVQIISGDALNPQANALARRRRIAGTILQVIFDGDNRPDSPVPPAEIIDSFTASAGHHLVEFALQNQRGQVIATGRQQVPVPKGSVSITELQFAPPDCEAMHHITCQTPATVTPATMFADAETEQCVTIDEDDNMSPVHGLRICIPPGVLEEDITVQVVEVYNLPNGVPDHASQAGVIVDIRFDPQPFFHQPIMLQFPYDEALVATGEQSLGLNEAELNVFQLNRRAGQWVPLPVQEFPNTDKNMITSQSHALGFFVVGGPLPDAGNPPVANDQIVTTFVNTSVPITLTGSDADGNPLMFRVVSLPDRGTLAPTANAFVEDGVLVASPETALIYTPNLNFFGRDTFLFEAEEVSDARLSSILATVTILVDPLQSFMECVVADLVPGDACLGASPVAVAVADLDGDQILDLIAANSESNDVSVLLGQADMSFSDPKSFPVGSGVNPTPSALAVADFNNDGIPDLVTTHIVSSEVSILLVQRSGHSVFVEQQTFPVGAAPSDVAVGDLNNDDIPDLVTANSGSSNVSVLFGQGDGIFRPKFLP